MQNLKYKKFQRNYIAKFTIKNIVNMQVQEEVVDSFTIAYPHTLELSTKVGYYTTSAMGNFKFYNIDKSLQKLLWKDCWDATRLIHMELRAGYQDNLKLVYSGYVMKCYTYRNSGDTNYITELDCNASPDLFYQKYANVTINTGSTAKSVMLQLLDGIDEIGIGYISKELENLKRTTAFIGQVHNLISNQYSKYNVFIENGLINVLADNECKEDEVLVITAESGLLGSPRRSEAITTVEMLFEPNATVGMIVNVLSDSMPELNQTYQLLEIEHKGVISPVESGKLTTTLSLSLGRNLLEVSRDKNEVKDTNNNITIVSDWIKPVNGPVKSPFGKRVAPIAGASTEHNGVDIGANLGVSVVAPADGTIIDSSSDATNGNYIRISHGIINGKTVVTGYAHLNSRNIVRGQKVYKGDKIGEVGNTGRSKGAHLHFTVKENGVAVPPSKYVKGY